MKSFFLAVPVGGALNLFFLAWPRANRTVIQGLAVLAAGLAIYLAIRFGAGSLYGESGSAVVLNIVGLVLIMLGCLFFSGVKLRLFILPMILGVVAVGFYAASSDNRMGRILSALNPEACDNSGPCYQAVHGIWGMANGGIFGVGLGNSQEKYGWLPAAENDYIFAIVGEELACEALAYRLERLLA